MNPENQKELLFSITGFLAGIGTHIIAALENSKTGILLGNLLFIASLAGIVNSFHTNKKKKRLIDLQIRELEQRGHTAENKKGKQRH